MPGVPVRQYHQSRRTLSCQPTSAPMAQPPFHVTAARAGTCQECGRSLEISPYGVKLRLVGERTLGTIVMCRECFSRALASADRGSAVSGDPTPPPRECRWSVPGSAECGHRAAMVARATRKGWKRGRRSPAVRRALYGVQALVARLRDHGAAYLLTAEIRLGPAACGRACRVEAVRPERWRARDRRPAERRRSHPDTARATCVGGG